MISLTRRSRHLGVCAGLLAATVLAACSSTPKAPEPAPLAPVAALMNTRLAWNITVGQGGETLQPVVVGGRVFAASASGNVLAVDAATGNVVWRVALDQPLSAGVGSDGTTAVVINRDNQLIGLREGREVWRVRLLARSFTAPLVAGQRVFVLGADRSVSGFDAANGARLWTQTRTGDPLVLSQPGTLTAVGDTLVAGLSGRLAGLNPDNGAVRWEVPVATGRGTNEVERLVDVLGPASRIGSSICVRAYSAAVGCVDAERGSVVWTRQTAGTTGIHGDDRLIYGSDAEGRLQAFSRSTGQPAWTVDRLRYRKLSAPLALGRVVAFGDNTGLVHLVSREDGSEMTRLTTDGSPIVVAPVLAGDALVVQTRNGGLYAWRPQ